MQSHDIIESSFCVNHNLAEILTVEEIGEYLRIGRSSAYNLVNQPDFPAIRIGKQIRVEREALFQWMGNKKGAYSN
jgi:excisionase family DNA binding protein